MGCAMDMIGLYGEGSKKARVKIRPQIALQGMSIYAMIKKIFKMRGGSSLLLCPAAASAIEMKTVSSIKMGLEAVGKTLKFNAQKGYFEDETKI